VETFAEGWESYRDKVVPKDAGEIQVRETMTAFYAGAARLFSFLVGIGDAGWNPTQMEIDADKLDGLYREIFSFPDTLRVTVPIEIPEPLPPPEEGCCHDVGLKCALKHTFVSDMNRYVLEIRTVCGYCGVPFRFAGLPHAISLTTPCRDVSGITASLPIVPDEGLRVIAEGEPDWPKEPGGTGPGA